MNITACLTAEIESCQMKIITGIQILEYIQGKNICEIKEQLEK